MYTAHDSTAYWINRTARALSRVTEARLRPFGFGPSHLPILGALTKTPALTQSELARLSNVEQPTMAKLLSRMERDGLVSTAAHPDDRRATQASLTRKARTAFPKGLDALADAERDVLRGLNKSEQAQLRSLLRRVLANAETLDASSEASCEGRRR
jgi:DNA-binding MarR family transcriptional regulator